MLIRAADLQLTGTIDASGAAGDAGCGAAIDGCGHGSASTAGSGGGGAGGSIYLVAAQMTLDADTVLASGGAGSESAAMLGVYAGDGGDGRIRLDFGFLNGFAQGTEDATNAANEASAPNPGYVDTP